MRTNFCLLMLGLVFTTTGCHSVSFHELAYQIPTQTYDVPVTVVINQNTLDQKVSVRSFMTGIGNRWDIKPGDMLQQIADVEFHQMFNGHRIVADLPSKSDHSQGLVVQMSVESYQFENFHASVNIGVKVFTDTKKPSVLDKSYHGNGSEQGGKMFGLGAFGMKSAVRQSSLIAYKEVFTSLRADLIEILRSIAME